VAAEDCQKERRTVVSRRKDAEVKGRGADLGLRRSTSGITRFEAGACIKVTGTGRIVRELKGFLEKKPYKKVGHHGRGGKKLSTSIPQQTQKGTVFRLS